MKPTLQKNTLLKNAQAKAESIFFKRVFFSPTQRKIFANASFLIKLFLPPHGLTANTTSCASNVNRFLESVCKLDTTQQRPERRASGNSGFKKLAVQWLNEVQFSNQTFVVADSFVLRNRQLLKPAKRCVLP